MASEFDPHFILSTRFSWPHPLWQSRTSEEYDAWLEKRLTLFADYTAKSIANCYNKPDYWVILVGHNQERIQDRLSYILERTSCNYVFAPYEGLSQSASIAKACKSISYPARVITTNLDADDLVSCDFFAVLRSQAYPGQGNACVSFCSGCNYMQEIGRYYHSSYPSNPFLSLFETCRYKHELQTVYSRMHIDIMNFVSSLIFPRSYYPMWASVVHGGNLANNTLIETNRISFHETDLLDQRFGIHV